MSVRYTQNAIRQLQPRKPAPSRVRTTSPFRARRVSSLAFAVLLALLSVAPAVAIAARNPVFGYSVDLPVGWTDGGSEDPYHVGFFSPNGDAMLQVIALDPTTGDSGRAIANVMLEELATSGEHAPFEYLGLSASLTDVTFVTSGNEVRGYMVTIDGVQADYVLLAFAVLESYEAAHDHLLSALDSFAIDDIGRQYPGPISEFFYPLSAPGVASGEAGNAAGAAPGEARTRQRGFMDSTVPFRADPDELDAAAVLVEREARILAPYGSLDRPSFEAAWRRYFRMIYRDSYMRLAATARAIEEQLQADYVPEVDYPRVILSWLQGFEFERTGGLSDFQPPVSCLATGSGDCDSLALTYVILLHHMEIDSIVMVSDTYAHALAAVDIPGPGARFEFEETQWLVAELTDDVELGQIAASMADPAGWIGVRMRLKLLEPQAR